MTHPLRFCMITTFYPPYNFGGDGVFVKRLSNELAQRGHTVEVIHSIDAYRLRAEQPSRGYDDHPNVTVHGLASPLGVIASLTTQQVGAPFFHSKRIKQILHKKFDVIHYHNISLVGGPQILTYGEAVKLYSIHEYWLICPTHVLLRYNRAACVKPHCFLCSLMHARPPQWWRYSNLLRNAAKHVDAFIAPSRFSVEIHHQRGFDAPIRHVPYFVPEVPLSQASRDERPYFLFVGRLEKLKGLQTLIPVLRRYPSAKLFIAGKGADEDQLRQLAQNCENIVFLGHRTDQQLQLLYRNAVAVIVPSLCYEAFPTVILESFRQQTPVIARNLGAMPEMIEASNGGIVYATEEELCAAIERLLGSTALHRELGLNGYAAWREKWTTEAHLERYLELIQEATEARKTKFARNT